MFEVQIQVAIARVVQYHHRSPVSQNNIVRDSPLSGITTLSLTGYACRFSYPKLGS